MPVLTIHDTDFETKAGFSSEIVLLDFWAAWCTPCRMLAPVLEKISAERPELLIGKINVEEEPKLASRFHILSVPTLIVFQNGQTVKRMSGVHAKEEILAMIPAHSALTPKKNA